MSSPKRRTDTDVMKLLMSDYQVTLVNNKMNEFFIKFYGPDETPFAKGVWKIHVELPEQFPYKSPSIGFMNKIFHPNIDEMSGSVCLDVINQTWSPMFELINIFEIFLPQLLRYPNPTDPLNGEAAALLMRDPKGYNKKVEEYVSRFASPEDADQAGDNDDETDDEAVVSNGRAKAKANGANGVKASAGDEDEDEDEVMSDMGEMSDDEAAGDMEL